MAMIDSSIYFQQKTADPLGSYAEGMKMGDMIRQQQKQKNIENAFKAGMVQNPDGTYKQDIGITLSKLAEGGHAQEYSSLAQQQREQQAAQAKLQREQQFQKASDIGRLAGSAIQNPNAWMQIRKEAIAKGYGTEDSLPQVYDEKFLRGIQSQALTVSEQLGQQNKDREFSLKEKELDLKDREEKAKKKGNASSLANDLRKERNALPTTKATQEIAVAYNKIQSAAKNPSAAGDLSLIFGYMKMLDPGSTVREGEFATAQNAAGIPARVLNAYNNALKGERLSPEQRKDFIGQAGGVYKSQLDVQNQIDSQYKALAEKHGLSPGDVIFNAEANNPNINNQNTANSTRFIQVIAPNGSIKNVPENRLDEVLNAGGKLAPQKAGY